MKILTIGPRYFNKKTPQTGGIVVLFENWIEYCYSQNIPIKIIDTNKKNYSCLLISYLYIIYSIIKNAKKYDILFLHGTFKDYLFIAPWVILIGRKYKKKICLRKFAGSFEADYKKQTILYKKICRYVLTNADILFWETKALVKYGTQFQTHSYWFPNVRNSSSYSHSPSSFSRNFIFISRITKDKGVDYLKECFSHLDDKYHLDFYGPLIDYSEKELTGKNYSYKGTIPPKDVCSILSLYDILVLPTFWKSEGYPGVILEAFSIGIPVIASNIGGIPEIVKNGYNGIIIPPQNTNAIIQAIKSFNETNYPQYAYHAFNSFKAFETNTVNNRIIQLIQSYCQ